LGIGDRPSASFANAGRHHDSRRQPMRGLVKTPTPEVRSLQFTTRNVFPDLKVTWGTYPNNLGHDDFPGCFRCHDGSHSTSDQKTTITQDCNTCHEPLAIEEAAPGVLKTIGLADRITSLQK
jgi:hypothetical protein